MQITAIPSVQTPEPVFKLTVECAADPFPSMHWAKALQSIAAGGARHTPDGLWRCVRGPGYQIWVSEAMLHDRSTEPPRWHIGVESLMSIDQDARTKLTEVVGSVRQFLEDARLPFVIS